MKKKRSAPAETIAVMAIYISLLVIWQLAFYVLTVRHDVVKQYIFPSPAGVLQTFIRLLENGILLSAIGETMRKMLAGYLVSIGVGLILGTLMTISSLMARALKPPVLGFQTLPGICWVPFAILWFGLDEAAVIFVMIMGSTFSIGMAVESAMQNVNPLYVRVARTMGANRLQLLVRVVVPAGIPQLITGLKQGWSFAWRALMAGEMMAGTQGLGFILQTGRDLLEINQVMTVMIIIIMISVLIERLLFGKAETVARKNMGLEQ